jgi:glyoxylase-like metal-dependent hydrolase (beta-lactamase superfamily II)
VPEANVTVLSGGETVHGMRVAYTPGHASHHVCYLHEESGTAFVGDVAACVLPGTDVVVPPTPPPDIDIELWEDSIGTVEAWGPTKLALTHWGAVDEPAAHLAEVRRRIRAEAELARQMDEATYEADLQRRIAARLDPETADEMFQAVPTAYQWSGLDRYWRKKAEREGA